MKRNILFVIILLFTVQSLKSQSTLIDSLRNLIEQATSDTARISLTISYAGELSYNSPPEAQKILANNIKESKEIGYKLGEAGSQYALAVSLALEGKYEQSLTCMIEASKIYQDINSTIGYAKCIGGLGNIYYYLDNYTKAQSCYEEALSIYKKSNNIVGMASCLGNLGLICRQMKNYEKDLEYQLEGLKLEEITNNVRGMAISHISISSVYIDLKKYNKAKIHALKSIELSKKLADSTGIADGLLRLSESYRYLGKIDSSQVLVLQAIRIAEKIKALEQLSYALEIQTKIYDSKGNYRDALQANRRLLTVKDSLLNKEKTAQLVEMQTKFETERKEKENIILTSENAKQKLILIGLSVLIAFIIAIATQIYISRRKLKQAHTNLLGLHQEVYQQKEEIETQAENLIKANEAIIAQKDHIETTHQKISDSIIYASFIQSAMLPSEEQLSSLSSEYFILYKPRDVVSGDFYWFKEKNGKYLLAVADCTGHGVPGALLSMMGISFLNDIVANSTEVSVSKILEELRHNVKLALGQFSNRNLRKEGMEIGLIAYNPETKMISYSGAYLTLWLCRGGRLIEYKSDRMPIGISLKEKAFSSTEFKIEPDDILYMFTDGIADQLGGQNAKKYLRRNFLNLLISIHGLPLPKQKEMIEKNHLEWKGNRFEQIDDILVMGIKIK